MKIKLIENHWYKFNDRGETYIGYYLGRQKKGECCVCKCGGNAYTFNIWYDIYHYETWEYGCEHLPEIIEDMGERKGLIFNV